MTIPDRPEYRCNYCDYLNYNKKSVTGISATLLGDYGDNTTPTPELFSEALLTGTTIAFASGGRRETEDETLRLMENGLSRELEAEAEGVITDTLFQFKEARLHGDMPIRIETDSGINDGDYTIAERGVLRGEILLDESDSLTPETAAAAGTVVISRLLYQPNITRGCPFCGTLNSR